MYEKGYSRDMVLAGVLHDILEDTEVTEKELTDGFGDTVLRLVRACTKDDSISDEPSRTEELIKRCAENGEDALVVKAVDILDSFKYYTEENNMDEVQYCMRNANAILQRKPENSTDSIFTELEAWQSRYKA